MRTVIVCGGRDYFKGPILFHVLDYYQACWDFRKLVHGNARGADKLAGKYGEWKGIEVKPVDAEWDRYEGQKPNPAGWIRNSRMAVEECPDYCIGFEGGGGTQDMLKKACNVFIPVVHVTGTDVRMNEMIVEQRVFAPLRKDWYDSKLVLPRLTYPET